jgi:hypothetical protein
MSGATSVSDVIVLSGSDGIILSESDVNVSGCIR